MYRKIFGKENGKGKRSREEVPDLLKRPNI